jgi:sulfur-carrier protein adenylyltransferase/sulfurtransferase
MSPGEERAIVASEHSVSLGQQLRGWAFRFLLTRKVMKYIADLPIGASSDATIIDMLVPPKNFTAYIKTLGPTDDPDWQDTTIPDRGDTGVHGVLIRIASLADFPFSPEQDTLDQLIASARGVDTAPTNTDIDKYRFTVVADAHSATMFYSYFKEGRWGVFPYRSVHLTDDAEQRLPETYHVLGNKKVGIVGCGALGSKIAASLARSGVRSFVLVDDDILKPGNLVRHDLDVGSLGAHKAEALAARLKAITAGITVSARRVLLGGQESSGGTASVLDELSSCDLLIDATAHPKRSISWHRRLGTAYTPWCGLRFMQAALAASSPGSALGLNRRRIQRGGSISLGAGIGACHGTVSTRIMAHRE